MGGRQVQAVAPPDPVRRADPPPAAKTAPALPSARPQRAQALARTAPVEARPAPPSTGEVVTDGNTRTNTRARGQGFGISSAGGRAGGPVQLDVSDFCCPDYLEQLVARIQSNWQQNLGVAGTTIMGFTILRDGRLDAIRVERSSGVVALDSAAERALRLTARVTGLPAAYPNPSLTVHLTFDAQR